MAMMKKTDVPLARSPSCIAPTKGRQFYRTRLIRQAQDFVRFLAYVVRDLDFSLIALIALESACLIFYSSSELSAIELA